MKRLIYIIILFATAFSACKKDNNMLANIKSDVGAPTFTSPIASSAMVVAVADTAKTFRIKWNKADFGVQAVVNYTVQIDAAGKNFATAYGIGSTTNDSLSITIGKLNDILLNNLNLPPNVKSDVALRITAVLSEKNKITSSPIKLSVTTYKEIVPEKLFIPGDYQGWITDVAPAIRFLGDGKYEGYVYMNVGGKFKFVSTAGTTITYGDGGAGKLSTNGAAAGLTATTPGYYKLNADIKNLSYSVAAIQSFGLIGSSTAGGWDNSTPMLYDPVNGVWKATATLVPGALKFRANNSWDINYGPADVNALTGTLIQTNDAVTITQNGSYTVTIDFKQATATKYLYTVTKN
jgi:hypothetical protein